MGIEGTCPNDFKMQAFSFYRGSMAKWSHMEGHASVHAADVEGLRRRKDIN